MSHWDRPAEEPQLEVPVGLPDLLKAFAKAVIKAQPDDILNFGSQYFDNLRRERALAQAGTAAAAPPAAAAAADATQPPAATKLKPRLNVVICGAPAAGKGTQCTRIVESFGLCHISVGDLLRAEVANQTEAGLQAKQFMDNGDLVPDELVVGMVVRRLGEADARERGWLLDGFPRSEAQADALAAEGIHPDIFLLINVPDEILVDRVAGRRLDPETSKIYHLAFNPPPEEALPRLVQRSDDTEDKVRTRLVAYHQHTAAVAERYAAQRVEVDGDRDMAQVWADVEAALRRHQLLAVEP